MVGARILWNRLRSHPLIDALRDSTSLPPYSGYRLTPRRLVNLFQLRLEHALGRTVVRSRPVKLTIEAASACNLRCPACFTGVGERGRPGGMMPLERYRRLLDELGPYLLEIELYNWGEPLLNKDVATMIEEATRSGISTTVSTNFSFPYDATRIERLVRAGLTVLGVSIDGACQESYARYRVGGDFDLVLRNCRAVRDTKRRLGVKHPRMVWEFHVFPHNLHEIDAARALAGELDMDFGVDKGWVVGPEWPAPKDVRFFAEPEPRRCPYLWAFAVVNHDGGVSPCCGTFYAEDDMGSVSDTAKFADVWNGERFQRAREFFSGHAAPARSTSAADHVCEACPMTDLFDRWTVHRRAGGTRATFSAGFSANDAFNYFWNRRPRRERTNARSG